MQKLGINKFHNFVMNFLSKEVFERYWNFDILSEADLQSIVWEVLFNFLKKYDPERKLFKILNKPYLKRGQKHRALHPDIVVFKRRKPWIVIELKEGRG
jgi:hypothetical protein